MQNLEKLETIYKLHEKYDLASKEFEQKIKELKEFRVVTPIVGKFSTGKSSLLNVLFGKNYLGTKLTPETSIPTEIIYGQAEQVLIYHEKEVLTIPVKEFVGSVYKADEVKKITLELNDEFLKTIPTVKIVDMPGFDSGIELHNKAIDEYLPESRAYILTFAANDSYIPESIINFLSELKLHEMPVYIVITKSKSVTEMRLQECIESISKSVKKYLELMEVEIVCTNAKGKEIITEPLKKILKQIELESQNIFISEVNTLAKQEAERIIVYFKSIVKQIDLTPSELEAQKEQFQKQLGILKKRIEKTKEEFSSQITFSIGNIKSKIGESLCDASSNLETMLMNGMDIKNKVNLIVRESVIKTMKSDFEPKLRKYLDKMSEIIHIEVNVDTNLKLNESQMMVDNIVKETIKKAIPKILAGIGLILSGPIAAVVIFVTGLLVEIGFMKKRQEEQRQIAREKVYNEIIPQVLNKAGEAVNRAIVEQMDKINAMIEAEAEKQIETQEKALADIIKNIDLESNARNEKLSEIRTDLAMIEKLV